MCATCAIFAPSRRPWRACSSAPRAVNGIAGRDPSSYINQVQAAIREKVKLPPGYAILWSGQYEAMERVAERLRTIVPLTILLILLLLYLNTRSAAKTLIVALAVPFSAVGAIWLLYLLSYNLSIGVWVGLVALLGVDAETGVFMLLYLGLAYDKARREGRLGDLSGLRQAVLEGAARRTSCGSKAERPAGFSGYRAEVVFHSSTQGVPSNSPMAST